MALNFLNNGYFAGKVGIGEQSPSAKLQITTPFASSPSDSIFLFTSGSNIPGGGSEIIFGSSSSATTLQYIAKIAGVRSSLDNGSSDLWFQTTHVATATTPTTKMIIKSDGNVGIGTTSPSFGTGGGLQITNATQANLRFTDTSASTFITDLALSNDDFYIINRAASGQLKFRVNASTEAMTIDSNGNVGIGTTSPISKLTVNETGTATAALNIVTARYGISLQGAGTSNTQYLLNLQSNGGSTDVMRVQSSGNVGIGTASPTSPLTIKSNSTSSSSSGLTIQSNGNTNNIFELAEKSTDGARLQMYDAGVAKIALYTDGTDNYINAGNVGIGTTSPTTKLNVSGNISVSSGSYLSFIDSNLGYNTIGRNISVGGIQITTGASATMNLLDNGSVGINTTLPSEKLDVDGNARVRNLTAGIVTSSATGVLSTGGPTPMNLSLGEGYAANIREKYYRTNRTVYPSTIGSQFAQLIQQDLLNSMSLIMSPIATQTSEVSSVRPENNSGDFSFTRATKASRVASSGYIVRQTENYLRYSNEFNNSSYWTLGDATVTWGQADYFGKFTAWKLQDTASTAQHFVRQTTGIGGIVTVSVYAKAGTKSFLFLRGVEGTTSKEAFFNLSAGTVGTVEGITASMETIGSGWYRCSASFDHNPPYEYYFGVANADNVVSYTGDGTGNIYIVNPQIESGIGAREYNGTTSSMFYGGETVNVPRIDYKNGVPELLLEKTSTNVVYCSAKMAGLTNITQSFTLSPEGILNGIKINETATSNQHYGHVNCSVVSGTQYFLSFYIKKGTESTVTVYTQSNTISSQVTVNLDNGTISANTEAFIENVGGGWYRAGYKTPAASQTVTSMDIYLPVTSLSSYAGDVNNYTEYYGIQLETAPIVTSHIPTYDGAITRNNEIISLSNMATNTIASNATAGTLMVEFSNNYTNAGDTLQWHQSSTITGRGYFYVRQIGFADTWGVSGFSTTDGVNTKVIWRLNSLTSASFFKDGVKSSNTVTGTAWADIDKLVIRSDFGTMRIRNIFMSPTALTDDQCVKLTTINE